MTFSWTAGDTIIQSDTNRVQILTINSASSPRNTTHTLLTYTNPTPANAIYAVGDVISITNTTLDGHYIITSVGGSNNQLEFIRHHTGAQHTGGNMAKGDKDLTSLFSIVALQNRDGSGVKRFTTGPTTNRYYKYLVYNIKIRIDGVVIIPEHEELDLEGATTSPLLPLIEVSVLPARLILGSELEYADGNIRRPNWCPINSTLQLSARSNEPDSLVVRGMLRQNGGIIRMGGNVRFMADSSIRLAGGGMQGTGTVSNRIRSYTTDLHILDDYVISGSARLDLWEVPTNINGWRPEFADYGGFQVRSDGTVKEYHIHNFDGKGLAFTGDCFEAPKVTFVNLALEGEMTVTHNNQGTRTPVTKVVKDLQVNTVDINGNPLEWARIYLPDYDNGNRPTSGTYNDGVSPPSNSPLLESFDTDRIWDGLTLRGGVAPPIQIMTRTFREGHSAGGVYGNTGSGWTGSDTTLIDYRSKNNSYDDLFDIHVWQYNSVYRHVRDVALRGPDTLHLTIELQPDPYVTATQDEANSYQGRFTLNGNTGLLHVTIDSTLDQMYDYLKALKIDVNTEFDPGFEPVTYPSIDKQIGTADGTILDIGAIDIVVNDGITLFGGKKFATLKTTGSRTGNFVAGIHTGTHITSLISTEHSKTSIYYHSYNSNGTFSTGFATNDEMFNIPVPIGGWLEVVAKAPRHKYHKFIITSENPIYTISLEPEPHVRSVNLSAYRQDPDGLLADNVHMMYSPEKTKLHYGIIDLSDKVEVSKAILDNRMQTEEGMKFLFNFPESRLEEEYLLAENGAGVVVGYNADENRLNPKSFNTTLRSFVDWTSHDGLVYGLQGAGVRKVKVFEADGTRLPDRDFDLQINFPRTISYDDGHLYISDNNARMVFAFVAPTRELKGGIRDNARNYALDHANGNVDPVGADHYDGVHYIMDATAKRSFGYKNKARHAAGELDVSALMNPVGIAFLFGRVYVLDTGDPTDSSTGEIRAFVDGARDTENDVGATNDVKSIGAIRKFGKWPDSIVGGRPYLIEFDRIQINSQRLEYVRIQDMTAADLSKAGLYVVDENDNTYTAPVSYDGRVTFNPNQHITNVSEDTVEEVLKKLIESGEFSGLFDNATEILKHLKNNMVWSNNGTTLTLYDDDGTTPLFSWNITDAGRTLN